MAGPIVKYVGGKTRLLPELRKRMPGVYRRYYEPFMGGAALFFDLAPPEAILGDMNRDLVEMYIAVAARPEAVSEHLLQHRDAYHAQGSTYYLAVRDLWNGQAWKLQTAERAAAFIFMTKTCFNGLWRVNKSGRMNTPPGKYAAPKIFDEVELRAASMLLRTALIRYGDYKDTTATAAAGDFAYFDSPYDPISKTASFTSYTKDAFGDEQQAQLAAHAGVLRDRGVFVMLSNSDTPMIRDFYQKFRIETVRCGRSINSKAGLRGAVNEVLITGVL